jgi:hypothetical protein
MPLPDLEKQGIFCLFAGKQGFFAVNGSNFST